MSQLRASRNQLSQSENIVGCDLHATVLPYLACIAGFAAPRFAERARAHLDAVSSAMRLKTTSIEAGSRQLLEERGDLLEPFHCPPAVCQPLATACLLMTSPRPTSLGKSRPALCESVLMMSHGVRSTWSGVEFNRDDARRFRCRDFRRRVKHVADTDAIVPLGFDLPVIAGSTVRVVRMSVESPASDPQSAGDAATGPTGPSLVIELPVHEAPDRVFSDRPTLHFGGRSTTYRDDPLAADFGEGSSAFAPVEGEVLRTRSASGHAIVKFALNPTLMLRLVAMHGPKRFVVRVLCPRGGIPSPMWAMAMGTTTVLPSAGAYLLIGSLDATGVRGACISAEGWTVPSADWLPFVPFLADDGTGRAGSFNGLVDLLLELAATTAATEQVDPAAPPGHVGSSLLPPSIVRQGRRHASKDEARELRNIWTAAMHTLLAQLRGAN